MAFCTNCGQELVDGAKFCYNCGVSAAEEKIKYQPRKIEFAGDVQKCPNCGDIIDAYELVCEACGFEIRGKKASAAVNDLLCKLEGTQDSKTKDEIIRTFSIPNTKADIYEFVIISASHLEQETLETAAWASKMKQAYEKAIISFGEGDDFNNIKRIYNGAISKYRKKKITRSIAGICKWIWSIIVAICVFIKIVVVKFIDLLKKSEGFRIACAFILGAAIFLSVPLSFYSEHKEHIEHLEVLVEQVEELIEKGDFDAARTKASQIIDDTGWSDESEAKWNKVRKSLLDLINKKEKEANKK